MKLGSKYFKDPSLRNAASARNFCSQKSITADFTSFLKDSFVGGESRKVIGWGRRYFRDILRISRNQDLEEGLAVAKISLAWLARTLLPA